LLVGGLVIGTVKNVEMQCPICHQPSETAVSQEVSYFTFMGLITLHATDSKYYGVCNVCQGTFKFDDEGAKWLRDNNVYLSYWKWNIVGCSPIPALILFFNLLPFGLAWAVTGILGIIVLLTLMFYLF